MGRMLGRDIENGHPERAPRAEKREQFRADWPAAAAVIRGLERIGIFMLDVHPENIRAR